ncbi:MAG: sodium:proton antiporter [Pseudomonadota bacterium]
MLELIEVGIVITALFAWFNVRFVGLPSTIGVMVIALVLSLAFVALDALGFHELGEYEKGLLSSIDFSELLMQGMLSLLLFAGALHVDLSVLRRYRWQIGLLAFIGTTVSAILVGTVIWYVMPWFHVELPLAYCLAFGALISPTDPIAVMGILKTAGAPQSVEVVIAGESLFNDGVGIVLFVIAYAMLGGGGPPAPLEIGTLLLREAGGGIVFGVVLGYITFLLLRSIDSYQEEVLITLAAVLGGYALASHLHVSGPLAMVAVGLVVGNHGRADAMSDTTRRHLDMFWELIDAILNSVLFVLIGLEIVVLKVFDGAALAALTVIVVTLGARALTVMLPLELFGSAFGLPRGSWRILTWGGLRGGISVALALSLPAGPSKEIVVTLTYAAVIFSILVQGLTIGRVVRRAYQPLARAADP